jgi:hypothetical protein
MRSCEKWKVVLKTELSQQNLWPPTSPELTPADYFLWGLLKGKVYKNTPHTIERLKDAIRQEIQTVNVDTLGKHFYHQLHAQTSGLFAYIALIKIQYMFQAYPASNW